MINKKRFSINIAFTLFQFVSAVLIYYFLYKFLLKQLGVDQVGIWSIVLAISSTANIANLGVGSSVVRFTAKFSHVNDYASVNRLLYIALVLIGSLFFLAGLIIYFISPYWLYLIVSKEYLELTQSIILFSLFSLWLNTISNSVFLSCMDGLQKNYLRSSLNIVSSLVLLASSLYLVPKFGLKGAALAQICQAIILFLLSIIILKVVYRPLNLFHFYWDKTISNQLLKLGSREQIISISLLSLDPITRSLLARWGGLEFAAYYELANRLISQLKGLLVSANQLMLPIYAENSDKKDSFDKMFRENFTLNYLISLAAISTLISFSFVISYFVYGSLNSTFIFCTTALSSAYFINIISVPPYFSNIATGALKYNVIGTIIICILNIILSYILGEIWLGYGVVIGWALSLGIGSAYIIFKYQKSKNLSLKSLVGDKYTVMNSIMSILYLCLIFYVFNHHALTTLTMILTLILGGIFFIIIPFLMHPNVKFIIALMKNKFKVN